MTAPAGTPAQLGAASTDVPGDPTAGLPGDKGHGLSGEVRHRYHTEIAAVQTAGRRAGQEDFPGLDGLTALDVG